MSAPRQHLRAQYSGDGKIGDTHIDWLGAVAIDGILHPAGCRSAQQETKDGRDRAARCLRIFVRDMELLSMSRASDGLWALIIHVVLIGDVTSVWDRVGPTLAIQQHFGAPNIA